MRPSRLWTCLLLMAFSLTPCWAQKAPSSEGEYISWKKARVVEVVNELRGRDINHLTDSEKITRKRHLDQLESYAHQGIFPYDANSPRVWMPYFIAPNDARCALAHILEMDGENKLLKELAKNTNNAYISQLGSNINLLQWLSKSGLSQDEIAYIQDPHRMFPLRDVNILQTLTRPGVTQAPNAEGAAAAVAGSTSMGQRKKANSQVGWARWWSLNRDSFIDLRARYHRSNGGVTPNSEAWSEMPSSSLLANNLDRKQFIDFGLGKLQETNRFNVVVLMARAESHNPKNASALTKAVLEGLRSKRIEDREYHILSLGLLRTSESRSALQAIVSDSRDGRKLVARSNKVPNEMRALAAYALGFDGDASSRSVLLKLLEKNGRVDADVQVGAVFGLGLIDQSSGSPESLPALVRILNSKSRDLRVRAQIPAALSLCGDAAAIPYLLAPLKKFKGPADIRRGCALALGTLSNGLKTNAARVLMMSARRDPDANVREFSVIAIGKIAWRDADQGDSEPKERRLLLNETAQFLDDGVTGFFKQAIDQPWYALAAGLFAENHPRYAKALKTNLATLATSGSWMQARAAAALAMGLSSADQFKPLLRKQLTKEKAPFVRGYMIESLGLLRDSESRDVMQELAFKSKSDFLRFQGACALAALGDVEMAPLLVKALSESKSASVRAAITRALGRIGDRRSMAGLFELANDKNKNNHIRSRAISALGMTGRTEDDTWTLPVRASVNPTSMTPTLRIITSIF